MSDFGVTRTSSHTGPVRVDLNGLGQLKVAGSIGRGDVLVAGRLQIRFVGGKTIVRLGEGGEIQVAPIDRDRAAIAAIGCVNTPVLLKREPAPPRPRPDDLPLVRTGPGGTYTKDTYPKAIYDAAFPPA